MTAPAFGTRQQDDLRLRLGLRGEQLGQREAVGRVAHVEDDVGLRRRQPRRHRGEVGRGHRVAEAGDRLQAGALGGRVPRLEQLVAVGGLAVGDRDGRLADPELVRRQLGDAEPLARELGGVMIDHEDGLVAALVNLVGRPADVDPRDPGPLRHVDAREDGVGDLAAEHRSDVITDCRRRLGLAVIRVRRGVERLDRQLRPAQGLDATGGVDLVHRDLRAVVLRDPIERGHAAQVGDLAQRDGRRGLRLARAAAAAAAARRAARGHDEGQRRRGGADGDSLHSCCQSLHSPLTLEPFMTGGRARYWRGRT